LTEEGRLGQREIARNEHVALYTVQNMQKKWHTHHQLEDLPHACRPRAVPEKIMQEIDMQVMRNRLLTPWDVHQYLIEEHSIVVSITTVHNILKRANIRFYSQRPKPQLTRKQKLARVAKARE
jgi:transposase